MCQDTELLIPTSYNGKKIPLFVLMSVWGFNIISGDTREEEKKNNVKEMETMETLFHLFFPFFIHPFSLHTFTLDCTYSFNDTSRQNYTISVSKM